MKSQPYLNKLTSHKAIIFRLCTRQEREKFRSRTVAIYLDKISVQIIDWFKNVFWSLFIHLQNWYKWICREKNPVKKSWGTEGLNMVSLMKYRSMCCEKIKTWAKNQSGAGQPSEGVFIVWDQGGFIYWSVEDSNALLICEGAFILFSLQFPRLWKLERKRSQVRNQMSLRCNTSSLLQRHWTFRRVWDAFRAL